MEREFLEVAKDGKVEVVKDILRKNPKLDVNFDDYGWTFLHYACRNGHDAIVSILLAHPDIDVNLKDYEGQTPFMFASGGYVSCVREMLKDSRMKANEPEDVGFTTVRSTSAFNQLEVIKRWIASGREMNLGMSTTRMPLGRQRNMARQKRRACWRDSIVMPPRPNMR